jgi:hypothetical protein
MTKNWLLIPAALLAASLTPLAAQARPGGNNVASKTARDYAQRIDALIELLGKDELSAEDKASAKKQLQKLRAQLDKAATEKAQAGAAAEDSPRDDARVLEKHRADKVEHDSREVKEKIEQALEKHRAALDEHGKMLDDKVLHEKIAQAMEHAQGGADASERAQEKRYAAVEQLKRAYHGDMAGAQGQNQAGEWQGFGEGQAEHWKKMSEEMQRWHEANPQGGWQNMPEWKEQAAQWQKMAQDMNRFADQDNGGWQNMPEWKEHMAEAKKAWADKADGLRAAERAAESARANAGQGQYWRRSDNEGAGSKRDLERFRAMRGQNNDPAGDEASDGDSELRAAVRDLRKEMAEVRKLIESIRSKARTSQAGGTPGGGLGGSAATGAQGGNPGASYGVGGAAGGGDYAATPYGVGGGAGTNAGANGYAAATPYGAGNYSTGPGTGAYSSSAPGGGVGGGVGGSASAAPTGGGTSNSAGVGGGASASAAPQGGGTGNSAGAGGGASASAAPQGGGRQTR